MPCEDKVRHATLRFAAAAAVQQHEVHGRSHQVYACRTCGGFHLSSHAYGKPFPNLTAAQLAALKELAR